MWHRCFVLWIVCALELLRDAMLSSAAEPDEGHDKVVSSCTARVHSC